MGRRLCNRQIGRRFHIKSFAPFGIDAKHSATPFRLAWRPTEVVAPQLAAPVVIPAAVLALPVALQAECRAVLAPVVPRLDCPAGLPACRYPFGSSLLDIDKPRIIVLQKQLCRSHVEKVTRPFPDVVSGFVHTEDLPQDVHFSDSITDFESLPALGAELWQRVNM